MLLKTSLALWAAFLVGTARAESIAEFRQGETLPLNLTLDGDLLEGTVHAPAAFTVKRTFWVKLGAPQALAISFDGQTFKPWSEAMEGLLTIGTGSEAGLAQALEVALRARIR